MQLEAGEHAAIQLALAQTQALLLLDDAAGRKEAQRLGLANIGTLGLLRLAAITGLVDLRTVLGKLIKTNFRVANSLITELLAEDDERHRSLPS